MAERKRRREKFFKEHPLCCFCGGFTPANEIDHQPPKAFFLKKASPAELRFPSCSICNRSSSPLDQNLAFFSRFDATGKYTEDYSEMSKMITALHNNYPTLKPFGISNNDKRGTLRSLNLRKRPGQIWDKVPMVGFNNNVQSLYDLSLAKIAVGFFYLVTKEIAPAGARILVITERDIVLREPDQLEMFNLKYEDFKVFKNNSSIAESQIGVKISHNEEQSLFSCHLRLNQATLSTVAILYDGELENDEFEWDYRISRDGFPWGVNIQDLLLGEPHYKYYKQN